MSVNVVPLRRATSDSIHADILPSACTVDSLATHNRTDPYWDSIWAPGSQAHWATSDQERARAAGSSKSVNQRFLMDNDEAVRVLTSNRFRAERLAGWSAIDSWRTLTAEQVAALTGCTQFLDPRFSAVAASFSLDLLDIGSFPHAIHGRPGLNRDVLYRPSISDAFDKTISPTLTYPEWLGVTGGYPWSSAGQYDRHNVLAAELALRAAEYLPIGTVLGEKYATVDLLAGTGLGKTVNRPDNRRADGVIVREDGLRIAYELTATASAAFESKVRRWAQIISERPLETSGLVIVFIAAPHPKRSNIGRDPRNEIYRRLSKVLQEFPGTGADSPAARIGVASWDEWFPARHEMSEAFLSLQADFALAGGRGAAKWEPRKILTDYAFGRWHTFDAAAVIDNSKLIAGTPFWLRTGDHTRLIGTPMQRAGHRVPRPAPARPEQGPGIPLGAARGNGGRVKLPPRLRASW